MLRKAPLVEVTHANRRRSGGVSGGGGDTGGGGGTGDGVTYTLTKRKGTPPILSTKCMTHQIPSNPNTSSEGFKRDSNLLRRNSFFLNYNLILTRQLVLRPESSHRNRQSFCCSQSTDSNDP